MTDRMHSSEIALAALYKLRKQFIANGITVGAIGLTVIEDGKPEGMGLVAQYYLGSKELLEQAHAALNPVTA